MPNENTNSFTPDESQGRLFDSQTTTDGVPDPEMAQRHEHYDTASGVIEGSIPEAVEANDPQVADTNLIGDLQALVKDISSANMRHSFSKAPPEQIIRSAASRGLSAHEAVRQAERNQGDYRSMARQTHEGLTEKIAAGIGLLAALGVQTQGVKPRSFEDVLQRVSGPENRNLRQRLSRASEWRPEFLELLIKQVPQTEVEQPRESDESLTPYRRLVSRFGVAPKEGVELSDMEMLQIPELEILTKAKGYPKGVLLSEEQNHAFVRAPRPYARSLRRPEEPREGSEYQNLISEKIVWLQELNSKITDRVETITMAESVIQGEVHNPDQAAEILREVMNVILEEVQLGAKHSGATEDQISETKESVKNILLNRGNPDYRRQYWAEAVKKVGDHLGAQQRLFVWNIAKLQEEI